jgi:transcriptional regulator with XRE-family HTH domain
MFALELYRRSRGLTLRALGAASGIHFTKLSRAEHGLELSAEELARVAAVLKCEPSTLRGRATLPVFESVPLEDGVAAHV